MNMQASPQAEAWYKPLHIQIFIAMLIGALLGAVGGDAIIPWIGWTGTVFVRLMRMLIVPLIFTSIVQGVASVGSGGALGRLGAKTFAYYISTSFLAIFLGLVLVNLLKPGVGANIAGAATRELPNMEAPGSMWGILLRMIPNNPIAAMASGDMLGIIFFAIVLGVSLAHLGEKHRAPLLSLADAAFELMMVVTSGVMKLLPIGVVGLIARAVAGSDISTFRALGMYMLTIFLALMIHLFVVLPVFMRLVGRMNPWTHFRNMREAMLTAFSTSSSAVTLPVTLRCVEQRVGVSNRVSSFVLPMGATVNMDGTALYECVGVIFIAQALGVELSFVAQMTIVLTALLASIGAAGIPSAGLVMIFIVTKSVNLVGPEVDVIIGTMLAIDRPLDMLRTVVNVTSDSCGAAVVARSEGELSVNES